MSCWVRCARLFPEAFAVNRRFLYIETSNHKLGAIALCFFLCGIAAPAFAQGAEDAATPEDAPTPALVEEEAEEVVEASSADADASAELAGEEKSEVAKEVEPEPLELSELIELARQNAAAMHAEQARVKNAEWQRFRAKYAWTPKISADTLLAPVPADTDINDFSNNVSNIVDLNIGPFFKQTATLLIPVYTFGRINNAKALAEIGVDNAKLEQRKAELDLVFQVRRAYVGLQLARAFDAMLAEGKKLVGEQLVRMEDARDFGEADFDIADFRKLQIFQADLDARALDNEKLLALGTAGLEYLTDDEIELARIPMLDDSRELPELAPFETYRDVALSARPEVRQLGYALDARERQLDLSRSAFFPNIFFATSFSYGWSSESISKQPVRRLEGDTFVETDLVAEPYSNPYDQLGFGVSLGMRWNFDFFQLYGAYKETEAQVERTKAQRTQALGAIDLELQQLYTEARQARQKVEIVGRKLEAARRWRDQLGLSMQTAGADVSDAIEPLRAFYEAKVTFMQAVAEYEIARAALAKGIGVESLDGIGAP